MTPAEVRYCSGGGDAPFSTISLGSSRFAVVVSRKEAKKGRKERMVSLPHRVFA